jgi:hypothetical protein
MDGQNATLLKSCISDEPIQVILVTSVNVAPRGRAKDQAPPTIELTALSTLANQHVARLYSAP